MSETSWGSARRGSLPARRRCSSRRPPASFHNRRTAPHCPRHNALRAILRCLDRLQPEDRQTLKAVIRDYLLPDGRRWLDAADKNGLHWLDTAEEG